MKIEQAKQLKIFTLAKSPILKDFLDDSLNESPPDIRNVELEKLQTITGIGPKRTIDLYDNKKMTLEKLLNGEGNEYLTHHQKWV